MLAPSRATGRQVEPDWASIHSDLDNTLVSSDLPPSRSAFSKHLGMSLFNSKYSACQFGAATESSLK